MTDLERRAMKFCEDHGFDRVIWDGRELTAEDENGQPFNQYEFLVGTFTRMDFEGLEANVFREMGGETWEFELEA